MINMQLTVPQAPSLLVQKPTNTCHLSPPLVAKNDEKIKVRPWRLTPPLKKRHVRISLDDHTDSPIKIAPLKAKKTLKKPKHKVRFSRVIKTRTLKKERTQLTPEEHHNMWYHNREYAEMDQDSFKNIRALHAVQGNLARLPSAHYCLRGLEMKSSPQIHRLRRLRASITVRAVLDQQDYQRRTGGGKSDLVGDSLANVSRQFTRQAQHRARELGVIDSIESHRSC